MHCFDVERGLGTFSMTKAICYAFRNCFLLASQLSWTSTSSHEHDLKICPRRSCLFLWTFCGGHWLLTRTIEKQQQRVFSSTSGSRLDCITANGYGKPEEDGSARLRAGPSRRDETTGGRTKTYAGDHQNISFGEPEVKTKKTRKREKVGCAF